MDYERMSNALRALLTRLAAVITLTSVLFVTSCRSEREILTETVYVDRCFVDTIISVEADTASMKALLECDSLNNVVVAELATMQGQRVSVAPEIRYVTVRDETGQLRRKAYMAVVALADSLQTEMSIMKETERREKTTIETPRTVPWKAFILGMVFGFLITLGLIIVIKK